MYHSTRPSKMEVCHCDTCLVFFYPTDGHGAQQKYWAILRHCMPEIWPGLPEIWPGCVFGWDCLKFAWNVGISWNYIEIARSGKIGIWGFFEQPKCWDGMAGWLWDALTSTSLMIWICFFIGAQLSSKLSSLHSANDFSEYVQSSPAAGFHPWPIFIS